MSNIEEFTIEGMYKEIAEAHISGRKATIKYLEAQKESILIQGGKEREEELSGIFDETIKRLKSEIVELKKVKVTHKEMREEYMEQYNEEHNHDHD